MSANATTASRSIINAFPGKANAGLRAAIRNRLRDPAYSTAVDALESIHRVVALSVVGKASMDTLAKRIDDATRPLTWDL